MKLDRGARARSVVIDVQEAFRKARAGLRRGRAAQSATLVARRRGDSGSRSSSPSSTRRAWGRPSPRSPSTCPRASSALEKVRFSAAEAEGFDLGERDQAIVCGIEAHVCVNQTVLDLLESGTRGPRRRRRGRLAHATRNATLGLATDGARRRDC